MKIKCITIELVGTESEKKGDNYIAARTIQLMNSKWSCIDDNDGLFPGEVRLISMIDEVRNRVGSI